VARHQPPPAALVRSAFPTSPRARALGLDLTREPIPVVPAAHYMCGGVVATSRAAPRSRAARARRGGVHRAPRRQPARQQLAARGAGRRAPRAPRRSAQLSASTAHAARRAWRTRGARPPLETVLFDHNWDACGA
jgi:L-aspartate oxidase